MSPSRILLAVLLFTPAVRVAAGETDIALAEDPARIRVQAACSMCHSLDYIEMNSPFLDRAGWERTVRKMVTIMGAPLNEEQAAEIADYLARHYGKKPPAPGP